MVELITRMDMLSYYMMNAILHFSQEEDGLVAWQNVRDALRYPSLLKKCTWQQFIASILREPGFRWLTDSVREKYGF